MTIGRVYVATSKGFPGRVKLGCTLRTAKVRVGELQRHYGTRHKFSECFSLLVHNPYAVEALAHRRLGYCRDPGTEMFRCTREEAKRAILWAADEVLIQPIAIQPPPKRAQKRRRRGRLVFAGELALAAFIGLALTGLIFCQPQIPDWLPVPMQNTALRIEGQM